MRTPGHRDDIDGLRAIAVLAVLAYHAFPQALPGGFVGVDGFFVISGYLITGILLRAQAEGRFSLWQFYQRRVNRIFPALLLVLTVTLLVGCLAFMPPELRQLGLHVDAGAAFVANILLWREAGYFDAAAQFKPLLHLWSLGIEEQFYLLWPLCLLLWRRPGRGLLATSAGLFALSLAVSVWGSAGQPEASFYLLHTRTWELMLGALLAQWQRHASPGDESDAARGVSPPTAQGDLPAPSPIASTPPAWKQPAATWAGAAGLLLIAGSACMLSSGSPYPGWRALAPTVGTALLIAAGAQAPINRLLAARALVAIGLISYPLYLWHWPVLAFARVLYPQALTPAWTAALLGLSLLLAWLTYRVVEIPVRLAQQRGQGPAAARRLVAGMVLLAGAAGAVQWADGLPQRYPAAVRHLVDYRFDHDSAYRSRLCFIDRIEDVERALHFSDACIDPPTPGRPQPLVVLWGDSTGAHLYPGLKALQASRPFRLAQFTASSCPPVVGYKPNALCAQVNAATAQRIATLGADTVLLSGLGWTPEVESELAHTVALLRQAGVRRIVLVGSPPHWMDAPPRLLYRAWAAHPDRGIPTAMADGLLGDNPALDQVWSALAGRLGVAYASSYQALCDARGCQVRDGDAPQQVLGWDTFHLTTTGSVLLMSRLADALGLPPAGTGAGIESQPTATPGPAPTRQPAP